MLGLTVTSPQGRTWSFKPHLSGLSAAEGGFETPLGWYGAKWELSGTKGGLRVELDTPLGTMGSLALPAAGKVSLDGQDVHGGVERSLRLDGGIHTIVVV